MVISVSLPSQKQTLITNFYLQNSCDLKIDGNEEKIQRKKALFFDQQTYRFSVLFETGLRDLGSRRPWGENIIQLDERRQTVITYTKQSNTISETPTAWCNRPQFIIIIIIIIIMGTYMRPISGEYKALTKHIRGEEKKIKKKICHSSKKSSLQDCNFWEHFWLNSLFLIVCFDWKCVNVY